MRLACAGIGAATVLAGGCTETAHTLTVEEAQFSQDGVEVIPHAVATEVSPSPRPQAVRRTPPAPPQTQQRPSSEGPELDVRFSRGDGTSCRLVIEAAGFPAYDPNRGRIVTLARFAPQMTDDLGTLDVVWYDAATGEEVERIAVAWGLYDESGDCEAARRSTKRGVRKARRRLAETAYEFMPPVPLSWITFADMHFGQLREARTEALAAGEDWVEDAPKHVEAFERDGELIVRVRGVAVLERLPTAAGGDGITLHAINAHRETGTVMFTGIDCAGESCTCDPTTEHAVMHMQPSTLARIDRKPCIPEEAYDECGLRSVFANGKGEPWNL